MSDYYKVVFIGDSCVGKTSIITRLAKGIYDPDIINTVAPQFTKKVFTLSNKKIEMQIWDTAGQERFQSLIPLYLHDSDAVVLVFDLTNEISFDKLFEYWIPFLQCYIHKLEDCSMYILGNKSDLLNEDINVDFESRIPISEFIKYYKVSAKTGDGIYSAFENLARDLAKNPTRGKKKYHKKVDSEPIKIVSGKEKRRSKFCCYY